MSQPQETTQDDPEFYVFRTRNGGVEIKKVLIGSSIGVADERPEEPSTTLTSPPNPLPEGIYTGTLKKILAHMQTEQSPEEPTLRKFLEKIKRSLKSLFS